MIVVRNARTLDQIAPDVLNLEKMFEGYPTEHDVVIFIDTIEEKNDFIVDVDEDTTFYVFFIDRNKYNDTEDKEALIVELFKERLKNTELKEAIAA